MDISGISWLAVGVGAGLAGWFGWKHFSSKKKNSKNDPIRKANEAAGNTWTDTPHPSISTPAAWASSFSTSNIFYMVAGVLALGIGIAVQDYGTLTANPRVSNDQLGTVRKQLEAATNQSIPGDLYGKVFIRRGDDIDNDKVVYVTDNGDGTSSVNLVTLSQRGFAQGPGQPNGPSQPFFDVDANGNIIVRRLATQKLAGQSALLAAATVGGLSAHQAANAVQLASTISHDFTMVPSR